MARDNNEMLTAAEKKETKSLMTEIFVTALRMVLLSILLLYVVIPCLLFAFPSIHNAFLFMNFANWPFTNYSDLKSCGVVSGGFNFYLSPEDGVTIGAWHVLPANSEFDLSCLHNFCDSNAPIIVYLHGNSFSRAQGHRIDLYNVLAAAGYRIVTFDYRGFGDSTSFPQESTCISDAELVYQWALERASPSTRIYIWGHSLGTAIGTRLAHRLCAHKKCPSALILEAPFNNFTSIVRHHPFTQPYRWMPFFDSMLVDPPRKYYNIDMNSDEHIAGVNCPILLLHAQDDPIVSINLPRNLYNAAVRAQRTIKFVELKADYGYRHNNIWRAPNLPFLLEQFFQLYVVNPLPGGPKVELEIL